MRRLLDDQLGRRARRGSAARSGSPSSRSAGTPPPPGRAARRRGARARARSGSSRDCSSPTSAVAIAARIACEGRVWVSERRSIISPQSNEPLTSHLDRSGHDTARPAVHPARDRAEGRPACVRPDTRRARLALPVATAGTRQTKQLTVRVHDKHYKLSNTNHTVAMTVEYFNGTLTTCGDGNEKSYQVDGNKVWSSGDNLAWRCVKGAKGRIVKILALGEGPACGRPGDLRRLGQAPFASPATLARWTSTSSPRPSRPSRPYRTRQVWEWAARGAASYGEMTNVSSATRALARGARAVLDARARARGDGRPTARSRRSSTRTTATRSRPC